MSMVSVKTLEIAGVRTPDLSKCKEVFEKYSKFYKEEDVLEILEVTARNTDVVKLFLESVNCRLNGQKISGIIGKIFSFQNVPSFEEQQKIVSIYALMLEHLSDEKDVFVLESIKAAIENGLIMLIIRVLEDTNAGDDLLIHVNKYEESHAKEMSEYEARQDKVFIKQVLKKDCAVREVIEKVIGNKTIPDPKEYFSCQDRQGYEPRIIETVLWEKELSECIHNERELFIIEDLASEDPEWDHFYEKDLSADSLSRMAMGEYNWDDGPVIPYVIVKQKNCDKATAQKIYDFADGDSYLTNNDPKPWELEWVAFFRALKYQIDN